MLYVLSNNTTKTFTVEQFSTASSGPKGPCIKEVGSWWPGKIVKPGETINWGALGMSYPCKGIAYFKLKSTSGTWSADVSWVNEVDIVKGLWLEQIASFSCYGEIGSCRVSYIGTTTTLAGQTVVLGKDGKSILTLEP